MRHNQNGRRYRGRSNSNSGGGNGGGGQTHHHNTHNNNGPRRINPRVHTFDSNGPDVRIRGNAFQIAEKYLTLAKDASSSGDRVLAESYLQHAEHYQRLINESSEEYNRHQPQTGGQQQQHNGQSQQMQGDDQQGGNNDHHRDPAESEQPSMPDLDQGFLVGPRRRGGAAPVPETGDGDQPPVAVEPRGRASKTVE